VEQKITVIALPHSRGSSPRWSLYRDNREATGHRTITNGQHPAARAGTFTIDGKTMPSAAEANLNRSNLPGPSS
jgi:hypothetical protein